MPRSLKERFIAQAQILGVSLSETHLEKILQLVAMVWETGVPLGLSGRKNTEEILTKDILDSLTLIPHLRPLLCHSHETGNPKMDNGISILDIGSGAGFPGIVFKIYYPEVKLSLLEAKQKSVKFLETVVQELAFNEVKVVHGRAEEFNRKPHWAKSFDIVVGRAVAPAKKFLPWSAPFLKPGGKLILQKGKQWKEELNETEDKRVTLGLELEDIFPGLEGDQKILVFRKQGH